MKAYDNAILITGASDRIGLELARRSLEMGYCTIIHYRRSADPARSFIERHPEFAFKTFFIQSDLSKNPEKLIDAAVKLPVTLIGVVNNAAGFLPGNITDIQNLEKQITINTTAPLKLSNRFVEKATHGWIINVSDARIQPINHTFQNYRISKLLLEELTRQQASLYAPNFRVNCLAPGAMLPAKQEDPHLFKRLTQSIPLKKIGNLQSLASAFEFLVKTEYITGAILPVDGGWRLAP